MVCLYKQHRKGDILRKHHLKLLKKKVTSSQVQSVPKRKHYKCKGSHKLLKYVFHNCHALLRTAIFNPMTQDLPCGLNNSQSDPNPIECMKARGQYDGVSVGGGRYSSILNACTVFNALHI